MATLVLSAAGAAVGGSFGGTAFGLSSLVLGKAVGATVGAMIDERLLGAGAAPVETGRTDRLRVMGSSEGAPLPRCFGRMRVAGQLVWSSRFRETVTKHRGGGKGGRQPTVREYGYTVSVAVALCEGVVTRVGRIWVDGQPVAQSGLTWRLHAGTEDQLPDPLIEAIEGAGNAPAYRGTAYVVIEDLDLSPYGSRIPQFNFEVFRRPAPSPAVPPSPALGVRGVALVPGTGEYALATQPVHVERGRGDTVVANVNNDVGEPDLVVSLDQLSAELPACEAVSLVVSWFGDDLRADRCALYPAVEQGERDSAAMPWRVSGVGRSGARVVSQVDGRPLFGGTPADASVVQAIRHMTVTGKAVTFYPFILMDITEGNGLENPWSPSGEQPPVPWRGRITLSRAPGVAGSPDKGAGAAAEVAAFFGAAAASDFSVVGGAVAYTGPAEFSYRRFILHYAHLCALAGGVEAFCIGSEMRSLTQIRDGAASYPAVRALCDLAADVRSVLGPDVKIGYAADWSEYFGHQPADGSGDVLYHLDELWAHPAIDFIGIDNYMPLSDWRDAPQHLDAGAGSIYDLGYLRGNVAGGEGYDWYYPDQAARDAQQRQPIEDGAYNEPWTFRYKDLVSWWSNAHVNRLGGVKADAPTGWQPRSKPIWFTELGCPAVDKGTNQPNVFYDPKSSESFLPYYSKGRRDDFIQYRYLQAMQAHWEDAGNNPLSPVYGGRMVDTARAFVWAWDARPWPDFPARLETWIDGLNHERGHWLNGRIGNPALAEVVAEICERSGQTVDVAALNGGVVGYTVGSVETARQSLQPLMLAFAFDSFAAGGALAFADRGAGSAVSLSPERLVARRGEARVSRVRTPPAETAGRVSLGFLRADLDYQVGAVEAVAADEAEPSASQTTLPIVLPAGEAQAIAERWLAEARIARESVTFALPPSALATTAGDVIALEGDGKLDRFRIDRIDEAGSREVTAVRVEPGVYEMPLRPTVPVSAPVIIAPTPVHATFLDLPLLSGGETPHAPRIAVGKRPWAGPVSVFAASDDSGYAFNREIPRPAVFGTLLDPLPAAQPGLWMRHGVRVALDWGSLDARSRGDVLNGANAAALRFGQQGEWEVVQFAGAELVGPLTYRLGGILRGQAGTDGVAPDVWPAGTDFVLLDDAVVQLDLPADLRGVERHYRVGPASAAYDDPSYLHVIAAFAGVGLRPYRPAHFAARRAGDGSVVLTWVRRTRIDGDSWQGTDVPVGEESLQFHLRVLDGESVVREFTPVTTSQIYTAAEQAVDAVGGPLSFEVAQVSTRFGPGPYARAGLGG